MVCEQVNYQMSAYKHIVKHMSYERFNFYLYTVMNELYKMKISGKNDPLLKHVDPMPKTGQTTKRKLIDYDSEEDTN